MPKFKEPLSKNPFHQWGTIVGSAAEVDPALLAERTGEYVVNRMKESFGMEVAAVSTEITVGGMFSAKTFPGITFSFVGHPDWASFLMGLSKTAGIINVDVVQQGRISAGMRRMNVAESKGAFSIGGAIRKAMTDQSAVEEESLHYSALLNVIEEAVEAW